MHLAQIRADNFRLLQNLSLRPSPRLNLFLGANAAGKTSLLESIYCLGRVKSFRGNSPAELAGRSGKHWGLAARLNRSTAQPESQIGLRWANNETLIRYDRAYASVADLVRALPVQILEPGMHRLLQDGPGYRRSFMDWGVFHVEHGFHDIWRRYQRALRQRNQALRRQGRDAEVSAWNTELVNAGQDLHRLREDHVKAILPAVTRWVTHLLGPVPCHLELRPGWNQEAPFEQRLQSQISRDRCMGMTVEGPHRAELLIQLADESVKNRISRGQQKLLIAALLLAQCELIHRCSGQAPVLLVDDFPAELAPSFQEQFLSLLCQYPGQVFITAFEAQGPLAGLREAAMFHVEQGQVSPADAKIVG